VLHDGRAHVFFESASATEFAVATGKNATAVSNKQRSAGWKPSLVIAGIAEEREKE
jgi:hypothetical protein